MRFTPRRHGLTNAAPFSVSPWSLSLFVFCSRYASSHFGSFLASSSPPVGAPFGSIAGLASGASAPLPGTVFYADPHPGSADDANLDGGGASVASHLTLGSRPRSGLANFGVQSSISRGFFTGPRASAQGGRRDGTSRANSHEAVDGQFHAEKFFQVRACGPGHARSASVSTSPVRWCLLLLFPRPVPPCR